MDGISQYILSKVRAVLLLLAFALPQQLYADGSEKIRIQVASRIFPSMIAAHQSIDSKINNDGALVILVLYERDDDSAKAAAGEIARVKSIRELPLVIKLEKIDMLDSYRNRSVAAIFLAEHFDDSLPKVTTFGRERGIITFSPFSSDVEKGVVGGIIIRDRIVPYINLRELRNSSINLRPFFIKVAETYE